MRRVLLIAALLVQMLAIATTGFAVTFTSALGSIKIFARPGQVVTRQFQLTLGKDQPRTIFRARIEDWWRSEDGKQSIYAEPGTLRRSCGPWVTINPVETLVEPGATLTIRVSVAIPAEVIRGGSWCALTVDEVADPLASAQGVGIQFLASVSTGIFVYIDPIHRAGQIADVQVLPGELQLRLRNDGNVPLGVDGRLEFIRPGQKQPAAVATIPRTTILPEPIPTGIVSAPLPSATDLPPGRYLVRAVLDIGLKHYIGVEREIDIRRVKQADDGSQ